MLIEKSQGGLEGVIPFIRMFLKDYGGREQISGCQGLGTVEEVGGGGQFCDHDFIHVMGGGGSTYKEEQSRADAGELSRCHFPDLGAALSPAMGPQELPVLLFVFIVFFKIKS